MGDSARVPSATFSLLLPGESGSAMRHLLTLFDLQPAELHAILHLARELKTSVTGAERTAHLQGLILGLVFEKPSLRTRVSFEAAMARLGGSSIFLGQETGWRKRETVSDFGRVLSAYLDVLVFRGNEHDVLVELAAACSCPVINGLTPNAHPCQAIADILTIQEVAGDEARPKVAYLGDGNNVARSLAVACSMMGFPFSCASPIGYLLDDEFIDEILTRYPDAQVETTNDPVIAVTDAEFVYTDVWTSMGQETERDQRLRDFSGFQVNRELMASAKPQAKFLHCLPAKRGEEVAQDVIDGADSIVLQQAENRMHAQEAVLLWLLKGTNS